MALGSKFRCMCNYGFCFEVYVNMWVFVAWLNFNIFGCMHNLKQTYDSVLKTVAFLWPPCPPITWPNGLHGGKVPHFTIILSWSIIDPLWLSIAQSHTFVLNLQHLNPVARCWSQTLNLIWLSIGLFPKQEKHRSARINSQATFDSTSIAILL